MDRSWRSAAFALAVAVTAVILGAAVAARSDHDGPRRAGDASTAAPVLERVDAAHPPAAWGGPDGRSALDGVWTERGDPRDAGIHRGWHRGAFTGRAVQLPYSPNARAVRGTAGMRSFQ